MSDQEAIMCLLKNISEEIANLRTEVAAYRQENIKLKNIVEEQNKRI